MTPRHHSLQQFARRGSVTIIAAVAMTLCLGILAFIAGLTSYIVADKRADAAADLAALAAAQEVQRQLTEVDIDIANTPVDPTPLLPADIPVEANPGAVLAGALTDMVISGVLNSIASNAVGDPAAANALSGADPGIDTAAACAEAANIAQANGADMLECWADGEDIIVRTRVQPTGVPRWFSGRLSILEPPEAEARAGPA